MPILAKILLIALCWDRLEASDKNKHGGRRLTTSRTPAEQPSTRSRFGHLLGKTDPEKLAVSSSQGKKFTVPVAVWSTSISAYKRHDCQLTRESGIYKCEDVVKHCLKQLNLQLELPQAHWRVYSYPSGRYLNLRADCSNIFEKWSEREYPVEIGQFKAGVTDTPIKITVLHSSGSDRPYRPGQCDTVPHTFIYRSCKEVQNLCNAIYDVYKVHSNKKMEKFGGDNCQLMSYGGEFYITNHKEILVEVRMCPLDAQDSPPIQHTYTIFSTAASIYRQLFPNSRVPMDKIKVHVRVQDDFYNAAEFAEWTLTDVYNLYRRNNYRIDLVEDE